MIRVNLGTEVEIIGTISDSDDPPNNVDPTPTIGWVRDSSGVVVEYEYSVGTESERDIDISVTRLSTGRYKLLFTPDLSGMWYAGFYSGGSAKASSNDVQISVRPTRRTAPVSGRSNC